MDINEAVSLIKEKYDFNLVSYLEYRNLFIVFPEPDGDYDDGLFVVDKQTKEVWQDNLTSLNYENDEIANDERSPVAL
jgi:tryptophan 2,3-dioxygenase